MKQFGLHALLLHNLSDESFFSINPSFWSLATEAQLRDYKVDTIEVSPYSIGVSPLLLPEFSDVSLDVLHGFGMKHPLHHLIGSQFVSFLFYSRHI
jgi:hypothetical protein